ncbi:RpiR family transcriptional regulator [Listeria ivanovii]|uniref:MurR/RpiR family transcriptional regulator n=1 Tax=Listeria ivanovii TaxID=1638 RepID=UPI000DA98781|nr:MurR/RpiR family transcriptional regulator [Listeria ivanovii]PZF90594.1 RpiR family transcriptional regulator [Listeria ivanovii]PZF95980.1 RpiR family transcriptional regulator [Listeria ivanovii]PZG06230.1 RpiR family transcriptional regulator [Listeria ivanovii]PZG10987.1 RpiR family transcriptional regulator [Listeria ivanovii]PZG28118.1 RpiR family transcriptional regulator [Listeria ivanovii]
MFSYEVIRQFTETEHHLYRYIMDNRGKVMFMRVRELSEATHVSPASIVRFTRKLGCEGFSEFKVKLKQEATRAVKKKTADTVEVLEEFFERTMNRDYDQVLDAAAEIINEADLVVFFGIGTSGILAEYGSRFFSNMKKRTLYIKDPFYPNPGEQFKNKAVMIILSVSGETDQVLEQAQNMQQYGSRIISITNTSHNTLAGLSDVNIPYYVTQEMVDKTNITTQIPVLFLLEAMAKKNYNQEQVE